MGIGGMGAFRDLTSFLNPDISIKAITHTHTHTTVLLLVWNMSGSTRGQQVPER